MKYKCFLYGRMQESLLLPSKWLKMIEFFPISFTILFLVNSFQFLNLILNFFDNFSMRIFTTVFFFRNHPKDAPEAVSEGQHMTYSHCKVFIHVSWKIYVLWYMLGTWDLLNWIRPVVHWVLNGVYRNGLFKQTKKTINLRVGSWDIFCSGIIFLMIQFLIWNKTLKKIYIKEILELFLVLLFCNCKDFCNL